jgi:2-keto-4-pentenoate hydratase
MTLDLEALARELYESQQSRTPVAPLTERIPDLNVRQAYEIQSAGIRMRVEQGRRVVGKKIGLTSKAMQSLLGVYEADYGILLDDMVSLNGEMIPANRMLQPRCEGEIAFLLKKDLNGPGVMTSDVLLATEAVIPALEIVDSRVKDWKIRLIDTVADNASSSMLVLGNAFHHIDGLDLRLIGMVFQKNGEILSTGAGAAVLGHPASAVAWLANKLAEYEMPLKAGEIILSGAVTAASPVTAGDFFQAEFDRLGSVAVKFC